MADVHAWRRNGTGLLTAFIVCGCATAPPSVHFSAEYGLPQGDFPARSAKAVATSENASQLIARGLVTLGLLEVRAKEDATTALLQEASRLGADVVLLHADNRVAVLSREKCAAVGNPGKPQYCRQSDADNGMCNVWSAPDYFECEKWEKTKEKSDMRESRASLWRQEPLAVAILRGPDAVRAALVAGENPNAGWLPLRYAIDRPDGQALHALLAGGARADARALGYAAISGKPAALESLLDAKAPVNQGYIHPGGIHTTALHEAVHAGNPGIVELLIARGADVNAIPSFGYPALNDAVASENMEVIRILMARGANPGLKGFNGTSAKDEAANIAEPLRERILRMLATANRN